jgi:hypothetical protein
MTILLSLKFDFYQFNWNLLSTSINDIREDLKPQTRAMKVATYFVCTRDEGAAFLLPEVEYSLPSRHQTLSNSRFVNKIKMHIEANPLFQDLLYTPNLLKVLSVPKAGCCDVRGSLCWMDPKDLLRDFLRFETPRPLGPLILLLRRTLCGQI